MKIEFDPTLIEQAVVHRVYGDRKLEAQLHRKIDKLYELPQGRGRDSKFVAAYAEFFGEMELAAPLTTLFEEMPAIDALVAHCLIRESPRANRDKAELLIKRGSDDHTPEDRRLIIEVSVTGLLEPVALKSKMRREFRHIADMLDEDFAYRREEIDGLPSRQNLVRDRYRVLWDIYIEGRLERQGQGDEANTERLAQMLNRVFCLEDSPAGSQLFAQIFEAERITHAELFRLSQSSKLSVELAEVDEVGSCPKADSIPQQEPGSACPLCGFPTFDWFNFRDGFPEAARQSILDEYPDWSSEQGACRQCIEIYASTREPTSSR